ncbi:MAG: hypothetical protein JNM07_01350 [Phycisphaerae bacterium]|nr:hypothetical protein [Phycisphaerae bacterium]
MSAPRAPSEDFRRRLAYYLIGVAVGLCLLGLLTMARQSARTPPSPGVVTPVPPSRAP